MLILLWPGGQAGLKSNRGYWAFHTALMAMAVEHTRLPCPFTVRPRVCESRLLMCYKNTGGRIAPLGYSKGHLNDLFIP